MTTFVIQVEQLVHCVCFSACQDSNFSKAFDLDIFVLVHLDPQWVKFKGQRSWIEGHGHRRKRCCYLCRCNIK